MSTKQNKPVALYITLKSGAQLTLRVTDWSVRYAGDKLTSFKWTLADDAPSSLVWLDLTEIAAITEIK